MAQRILVIDESPDILYLLQAILEDEGYEVIPCSTPFQEIVEIALDHPDLILFDTLSCSGQTGRQKLDRLLLNPPTASLPLIVLVTLEEQKDYLTDPHIQLVQQPFDLEVLLEKIKRALDSDS